MNRRRLVTSLLVAAVALGGAQQAVAGKKPAAPKPVTTTYYLHGSNTIGNADQEPSGLMSMDKNKPTGSQDKSFLFYGLGASPNTTCAGNALFPNWVGSATGNLTGTAKVSLYLQGSAAVKVQLFGDVEAQACNDAYPTPLGETTVPAPAAPGLVTVTIPIAKVGKSPGKVTSSFTLQLQPVLVPPSAYRAIYDSTASPASITWSCLPKPGKKTC